jgi:hypothetical protein
MASVRSSPWRISGESYQNVAVSIAHHQPLQASERPALEPRVLPADGWVLAHHEQTFDLAVHHLHEEAEVAVIAGDAREVPEAKFVFGAGAGAVKRLEQADAELSGVLPIAAAGGDLGEVAPEAGVVGAGARHRQIAGQQIVKRRDVGRALDRGVTA